MTNSRSQPMSIIAVAAEFGFTLWQERAPQGPWFLETPHDDHIFFGGDTASAEQCRDAIGRICAHVKENESLLVQQATRIHELEAELAGCRACRAKVDCVSRTGTEPQADWNYTGPGLGGPSTKD